MFRETQDDNSVYTQEILSTCGTDEQGKMFYICVNHDRGVRLYVQDIQNIFDNSFEGWLDRFHLENEPEYAYDDLEEEDQWAEFEVLPLFNAIDMVYSSEDTDKGLLCNMINAIENRLIRIW